MHVENLRLKFPKSEKLLFNDLDLAIRSGEKVLLLGPSGSGKSTFLHVLAGIIPQAVDVPMKCSSIEHPDSWGFVFQDPDSQFCMPYADEELAFVLENVQVPREEMPGKIDLLLDSVKLKLQDPHTKISTLSGGMKQKLAIASVLALEPDTLFLDEPTSMLDVESTKSIWDIVKETCQDKTLLIIEHKLDHVLEIIDRIILFNEHGNILADGSKENILSKYRDTLKELGVWYPEAWEDHLSSRPPSVLKVPGPIKLNLEDFRGYVKKEVKIHIPKATIHVGDWIAIKGENGAGKSTFLHSLMHFIRTTGTYEVDGIQVGGRDLPPDCAFVFQNPEFQFVTNSVFEEVAYTYRLQGMEEETVKRKVHRLLKRFKLLSYKFHHPYHLSMGQKRRLSVAASIVMDKGILLLDEPTFGQDASNTFALLDMLQVYQKEGYTILMVTHDQMIMDHYATRKWVIEKGKLVQDLDNEVVRRKAL
ncbi:energy-coupling factor ABC transporter ATP-binding protein (plasmid) [Cytobacillus spongiae]|uniref:ABC transporter ATP-binding protein n=1 Tax=Cytobacillus spongiae TaxID=2901381 RepID=UPI00145EDABD|nr:ABC transporter ATP-binding protein [Cytobacillus spongiae]MCA1062823.1 energy-coupling factor ABC transporter ATP-binding protein [Rossellomorea aquimaris]NMH70156.1 ABC transporter ATP-binding protein [Bacillus sp. RO3]UII58434.1 energy-coupling factor ABC transporter ATP-binding protein [Cytobacillus spongiae]